MPLKMILFSLVIILGLLFLGLIPFRKKEIEVSRLEVSYAEAMKKFLKSPSEELKKEVFEKGEAYFRRRGFSADEARKKIQGQLS